MAWFGTAAGGAAAEEEEAGGAVAAPVVDLRGDLGGDVVEEDGDPLSAAELKELQDLENWNRQQAREQRRRLRLLRGQMAESQSRSSGSGGAATAMGLGGTLGGERPQQRAFDIASPRGTVLGDVRSLPGTPGLEALEDRLAVRLQALQRSRSPTERGARPRTAPDTPGGAASLASGLPGFPSSWGDSALASTARPVPSQAPEAAGVPAAPAAAAAERSAGPDANRAPVPVAGWEDAVRAMTAAVQTMASSLTESKAGSVMRMERKRPTVRMESAESFMNEIVTLENAYAETNARTFRRRWGIFRPSLEGRAKETVDVELEKRGLTAEKISAFAEEDFKALYEYLTSYMERSCGLTVDRKAEIALATLSKVSMG